MFRLHAQVHQHGKGAEGQILHCQALHLHARQLEKEWGFLITIAGFRNKNVILVLIHASLYARDGSWARFWTRTSFPAIREREREREAKKILRSSM